MNAEILCEEIKLNAADLLVGLPRIGISTGVVAPRALPSDVVAKVEIKAALNKDFLEIGFSNQLLINIFEYSDILKLLL